MVPQALLKRYYGEDKYNGTLIFYTWVRQCAGPQTKLLNLGAGPPTQEKLRNFRGEIAEVVGADIDPIVLQNNELDRSVLIENGRLPLEDDCFDVVVSDYVLEHVERPQEFLAEVRRVLKPGGSYFFRTPNYYHYVVLASALTPHWMHHLIANKARGLPEDAHEPWPTFYRLNTQSDIRKEAETAGFRSTEMRMIECEPSYLMFHSAPFYFGLAYVCFGVQI
jgi:ubiquinone/menaquinone biosynthesis C-methylase UbiE